MNALAWLCLGTLHAWSSNVFRDALDRASFNQALRSGCSDSVAGYLADPQFQLTGSLPCPLALIVASSKYATCPLRYDQDLKIFKLLLKDARVDPNSWFKCAEETAATREPELITLLLDHPKINISQHLRLVRGSTELSWRLMQHEKFKAMDVSEVWTKASESFRLELLTDARFPTLLLENYDRSFEMVVAIRLHKDVHLEGSRIDEIALRAAFIAKNHQAGRLLFPRLGGDVCRIISTRLLPLAGKAEHFRFIWELTMMYGPVRRMLKGLQRFEHKVNSAHCIISRQVVKLAQVKSEFQEYISTLEEYPRFKVFIAVYFEFCIRMMYLIILGYQLPRDIVDEIRDLTWMLANNES